MTRPNDAALVTSLPDDAADVGLVGVGADDHADPRVQPLGDLLDLRPVEVHAAVDVGVLVAGRRAAVRRAAPGAAACRPGGAARRTPCTPSRRSLRGEPLTVADLVAELAGPATPEGVTIVGVPSKRQPDEGDLGAAGLADLVRREDRPVRALEERRSPPGTWKPAPRNGVPSWQPSTGWHPSPPRGCRTACAAARRCPRRTRGCRRRRRRGGSCSAPRSSARRGTAPRRAGWRRSCRRRRRRSVLRWCLRRALMWVARYAMPPAGTVVCVHPAARRGSSGLQQPVWIEPGRVRREVAVEVVDRQQLDLHVLLVMVAVMPVALMRRRARHGDGQRHERQAKRSRSPRVFACIPPRTVIRAEGG